MVQLSVAWRRRLILSVIAEMGYGASMDTAGDSKASLLARVDSLLLRAQHADPWLSAQQISHAPNPPMYLFPDFASKKDCDLMIAIARGGLSPASVLDSEYAAMRTSSSVFFDSDKLRAKKVVKRLTKKIEQVVMHSPWSLAHPALAILSSRQAEDIQVQRYRAGEYYQGHDDFTDANGYRRAATFLVYLTTVDGGGGGETVFPYLTTAANGSVAQTEMKKTACRGIGCTGAALADVQAGAHKLPYCCCAEALKVKAQRGTALLFFPQLPNSSHARDTAAWHGSCPVAADAPGEKWTLQQWWHNTYDAYGPSGPPAGADERRAPAPAGEGEL
jgi:hypothetical protein